ncbi:hypothetical protein HZA96_06290 [Candidatus Woesearchaeota archaeon]|nr:hypothetical protein [Candidatus Woesearchaeota archaeon]
MIQGILVDGIINRVNRQENVMRALEEELATLRTTELDPIKNKEHAFLHYELQQIFAEYILDKIKNTSAELLLFFGIVNNDEDNFFEDIVDIELRILEDEILDKINSRLSRTIALEKGYQQLYTQIAKECHSLIDFIGKNINKKNAIGILSENAFFKSIESIMNAYENIQNRARDFLGDDFNPKIMLRKNKEKEDCIEKIVSETVLISYSAYLVNAIKNEEQIEENRTKSDYYNTIVGFYGSVLDKIIELKKRKSIGTTIKEAVNENIHEIIASLIGIQLGYFLLCKISAICGQKR